VKEVRLAAGTIAYRDEGEGPPLLFVHGLFANSALWSKVVPLLTDRYRCITPDWPLGSHSIPLGGDLSPSSVAEMIGEFIQVLGLEDVTLVGNDTGGALVQLLVGSPRVGRIVLVSCEAFDNLPPGLTGRTLAMVSKLSPGLLGVFMQQLRLKAVRRLPITFGWLTKRGDAAAAGWMLPLLRQAEIRRDAVRVLRAAFADRSLLVKAAERLPAFDRPALVVWAAEDRVMPPAHGRRLAELLPRGRYVEVDDAYTLIPLDQPLRLGQLIKEFAKE
jgi:pimeloyl-ACP methyl ester carboxylesterase